jgi:hypothetical protein
MPLLGVKGRFGPFLFLQLYLMVSYHHMQTRKILGLPELIKYFCNVWQRMGVSYCFLVQASEIYYQTPFFLNVWANPLGHHQYRTVPRGITFNKNPLAQ